MNKADKQTRIGVSRELPPLYQLPPEYAFLSPMALEVAALRAYTDFMLKRGNQIDSQKENLFVDLAKEFHPPLSSCPPDIFYKILVFVVGFTSENAQLFLDSYDSLCTIIGTSDLLGKVRKIAKRKLSQKIKDEYD